MSSNEPNFICVETHLHSCFSLDSLSKPETILKVARKKNIDRVIITDHNTIAGALIAKQLDPQRVIIGVEIMTTKGELLAFYVTQEVPSMLTPTDTILRLREQGAFISVSHPFDKLRKGAWKLEDLCEIAPHVDAIETFNSRCMFPHYNHAAQTFARVHHLRGTAGSDAHAPFEIGRSLMMLPEFHNSAQFKKAITQAKFKPRLSSPFVHFYSRYAVWYKSINPKKFPQHFPE